MGKSLSKVVWFDPRLTKKDKEESDLYKDLKALIELETFSS